ncbi:MAG: amidohydrolase [Crocinitomicaceae bacterium]|jgi:amidohydrolase|nr:amidohydrolase [Crocinitomicaceae bacterium]
MTEIYAQIKSRAEAIFPKVKALREHLHQYPELSYQEFETSKFVQEKLREIGISDIQIMAETGVIAMIRGKQHSGNQPCIALRADLDALPINEENTASYISRNPGVMHACGHDVHTSILLGAAEILYALRDELPHPVKLVFQPGEEKNPGGASLLIAEGVLQNPPVKEMYALHVFPELEAGKLGFREGLYMASCDEIYMTIHGKGGHGATPHLCIDPIMIGATLITQLQQIVSRKCDPKIPCVLSFGHFEGIGATNVIPSKVHIKGTFRTMNEEWREQAWEEIKKQATAIVESQGGKLDLEISKGYPYLENDPATTQKIRSKAEAFLGGGNVIELPIRLTSEDFSFYSQQVPVSFFRLGVRNEAKNIVHGVHHPRFDIDAEALKTGIQAMCLAVF